MDRVSTSYPPVLVVPGWSDTGRVLAPCRDYLVQSGWPAAHVRCLSFRDRYGSNMEHAAEVADAVHDLARAAAVDRIAVIAHSMGGLAVRHYLAENGGARVHSVIYAGTPHRGTWAAWLAWGRGGAEMRPGSAFLERLNGRPPVPGVQCHCLRTPLDTRILPGSSAWLEGAECHTVRAPTHPGMLRHRATLRLIRELLLHRETRAA